MAPTDFKICAFGPPAPPPDFHTCMQSLTKVCNIKIGAAIGVGSRGRGGDIFGLTESLESRSMSGVK